MTLKKAERAQVFTMFNGHCAYCGCKLPDKGWHADHIEPVDREWWKARPKIWHEVVDGKVVRHEEKQKITLGYPERDVIENIFPACQPCNIDKGPQSLEGWRKSLEHKPEVLRSHSSPWRHAERFGLVAQIQTKVVFHFERVRDGKKCIASA